MKSPRWTALIGFFLFALISGCGTPLPEDGVDVIPVSPDLDSVADDIAIVTGRVVDFETGAPISGAVISTNPTTEIVLTTAQGEFVLQDQVQSGEYYDVLARADGYADAKVTILAIEGRRVVDLAMVDQDRALPVIFAPETAIFPPSIHTTEVSIRSRVDEPLGWSVVEKPAWLTVTPDQEILEPFGLTWLEISLVPEVFAQAAKDAPSLYGTIQFEDFRGRAALLNVVAVPAAEGLISLSVELDDDTIELGQSTTAQAHLTYGTAGLVGASVLVEVSGSEGGLEVERDLWTTSNDGRATIDFAAREIGEYEVTFSVPSYTSIQPISHTLVVEIGEDPCLFENGGCGDYAACAVAGDGSPVCTDIDPCESGDHPCDLTSEFCVNQVGGPPICEPAELPEVTITSGPDELSNQTSASFEFECSMDDCEFFCLLEEGEEVTFPESSCESGVTYPVVDGDYTFSVFAVSDGGIIGEPSTRGFSVDTQRPQITIETGPDSLTHATTAAFSFSCTKQDCQYVCEVHRAGTDPAIESGDCLQDLVYEELEPGDFTFSVVATDPAGNTSDATTWSWTIRAYPEVSIISGPEDLTNATTASFELDCSYDDCDFLCSLEGADQGSIVADADCDADPSYEELAGDDYTFTVVAVDVLGGESEPAQWNWTVDLEIPVVSITDGPGDFTHEAHAEFEFHCSKDDCEFECHLQSVSMGTPIEAGPCTSPATYSDLNDDDYLFTVFATDSVGNQSESVNHSWTVNSEMLVLLFNQIPDDLIHTTDTTFEFECLNAESCTFECALDYDWDSDDWEFGAWQDCDSPRLLEGLASGAHEFHVRATDDLSREAALSHSFAVVIPGWVEITGGAAHTCGITTQGALWCWGSNTHGRLGVGDTDPRVDPTQVGDETDWVTVDAGGAHTCGIRANGTLWCWGYAWSGRLGIGTSTSDTSSYTEPQRVGEESDWLTVNAGSAHTCGIRAGGSLWCWGEGSWGRLGLGSNTSYDVPMLVGKDLEDEEAVTELMSGWSSVSSTSTHTCGTRDDGTLYCWGNGNWGRLGQGDLSGSQVPLSVEVEVPNFPGLDPEAGWTGVVATADSACATRGDGSLWCWGENSSGQLAIGETGYKTSPVLASVDYNYNWSNLANGYYHICGLRDEESLWCWGRSHFGQLGRGLPTGDHMRPAPVLYDLSWAVASGGENFTCAVDADEELHCWGYNRSGQLGRGFAGGDNNEPVVVETPETADQLSAGHEYACFVSAENDLWCWGRNSYSKLGQGQGDADRRATPTLVEPQGAWRQVETAKGDATSGGFFTCGIQTDGTLWCWGWGNSGRLGTGNNTSQPLPFQLGEDDDWDHVSLGQEHSCAVKTDNSLWCWGRGMYGKLGNGSHNGSNVPLLVVTVAEEGEEGEVDNYIWKAVSAGMSSTCGIQIDGSAWCWGRGLYGRLGTGSHDTEFRPAPVNSEEKFQSISTGHAHACAITEGGVAYCWGEGTSGQLGNGASSTATSPAEVDSILPWITISAGASYTCGVTDNSWGWCWGNSSNGRLGQGSTGHRNSPGPLPHTGWTEVNAGWQNTVGMNTESGVMAWGSNVNGEAGDGTAMTYEPQRLEEVPVAD